MSIGRTVAGFGTLTFLATSPALAQITSHETTGNLRPTHKLGCISLGEVKSVYTPADLMQAHAKCRQVGRYEDAMVMLLIAGTYAWFDTQRVVDGTAHDAFQAMEANDPLSEKDRAEMKPIYARYKAPGSPEMAKFCEDIKRIGPPDYYPAYMVSHGMGAVFGASGGLVTNFDAASAWKGALTKWMHCDISDLK